METNYKITFKGEVVSERNKLAVKKSLAAALKKDLKDVEKYFSGEELTLAENLNQERAYKIQSVLKSKGAISYVEKMIDAEPEIILSNHALVTERVPTINNASGSFQNAIIWIVTVFIRIAWSCSIGLFLLFPIGTVLFVILDIFNPKSDASYRFLTNMYKWGSCHWFKQIKFEVKIETDDYDVDVKKRRRSVVE